MMARVWRGWAWPEKAQDYIDHLQQTVFPELYQIEGFRGASVLRRDLVDSVEFTVETLWESMAAIRQFTGENVEVAVVALAAQGLFREYETTVTHYEIVLQTERKKHDG